MLSRHQQIMLAEAIESGELQAAIERQKEEARAVFRPLVQDMYERAHEWCRTEHLRMRHMFRQVVREVHATKSN